MSRFHLMMTISIIIDIVASIFAFILTDGWIAFPVAFGTFVIVGFGTGLIASALSGE